VPPDNKPTPLEMENCQQYLKDELKIIQPRVIVALGRIAFDGILRIITLKDQSVSFAHDAFYQLPSGSWLVSSYHPSRQNTQTGRLSVVMFDQIWKTVRELLLLPE
jgi:uracil-DNA glycosylase family 4